MRVLVIGQLPKEVGGNYTTGAANVVYELSSHNEDESYFTFGTNISKKAAKQSSKYPNQFIGYSFRPIALLSLFLFHPIRTYRHIRHYKEIDNQNVLRFLFYENNIASAIKKTNPDIIHVHSITNLSPTRFALGGKFIPIILTCHGITYHGDVNDFANKKMYMGNIPLADYYTGSTLETASDYEKYLGIQKSNVTIIPNGIDTKRIYFDKISRDEIRSQYDVDDNQTIFLTIASVQPRKGQLRFLKLLKELNLDNFQYWIIGNGPDLVHITQFVDDNDLTERVRKLGYVNGNELYKYYSAADIYAHVSTEEGQALVELGSNATGLKCIVSKEIRDTISGDISSDAYFEIDFENPKCADLLLWLKSAKNTRSIGTVSDWTEIKKRYYDLYLKILKDK